jgi:hypothetical protein
MNHSDNYKKFMYLHYQAKDIGEQGYMTEIMDDAFSHAMANTWLEMTDKEQECFESREYGGDPNYPIVMLRHQLRDKLSYTFSNAWEEGAEWGGDARDDSWRCLGNVITNENPYVYSDVTDEQLTRPWI